MEPQPIQIVRLTVHAGRLACEVQLAPGTPHTTTPALMARVLQAFPMLPHHACVNEKGSTFAAVMDDTPLPHVLEHLVIDLQARAAAKNGATSPAAVGPRSKPARRSTYVGTSEWLDEPAGRARIDVSFTDDLVALRAFQDATRFLNAEVLPFHHDGGAPRAR